jgi:hypothetical protein
MKKSFGRVAVFAVLVAGVAVAATSPFLYASVDISSGVLSIVTAPMPKGWFSTRNSLDRTKTDLRSTYSFGATACSDAASGGSISSTTQGTFSEVTNPADHTTAYVWDYMVDLSANANHWYYHHHCDGTVEVHGCAAARPVNLATTAYATSSCRTYVNDSGQTVCASD